MSGVGGPERKFGCMIRLFLDGLVFLAMLVPMACLNILGNMCFYAGWAFLRGYTFAKSANDKPPEDAPPAGGKT